MKPILHIGIPTIPERLSQYEQLYMDIMQQVNDCNASGFVYVSSYHTDRRIDGGPTISVKRRVLIEQADAIGAAFHVQIDDDDRIAPTYIHDVLSAINENPYAACIGYLIAVQRGEKTELAMVSNRFEAWSHGLDPELNNGITYKQAPYFKVPIQTQYCVQAMPAPKLIWQEDYDFMQRLRPLISGRPEQFINKVLYHYTAPVGPQNPNFRY